MRKTMKKLTQGATRLLVLALGLGLVSTGWATVPVPTAVWETGEFEDAANLHGGYSISLNGNTVNSDGNIVIGDSSGAGATIAITDVVSGGASSMTVLYKYKTVGSSGGAKFFVSTYLRNSAGTAGEDIGAICWSDTNYKWVFAAQLSSGAWKNWRDSGWGSGSAHDNALSTSGGYVLFAFQTADKARAYTGSSLDSLAGFYKDGTTYSSSTYNGTMSHIGIGGPTGLATGTDYYGQWPGIVIEKVAIFIGNVYTDEDIAGYRWPSEIKAVLPERDMININISNGDSFAITGSGVDTISTLAGEMLDNAWQNTPSGNAVVSGDARNGRVTGVTAYDGTRKEATTLSDVTFTWAVEGSATANYGSIDIANNPTFHKAWLARANKAAETSSILVQSIPYRKYDVIVYCFGADDTAFNPVFVNGVPYVGDTSLSTDTNTRKATSSSETWGGRRAQPSLGQAAIMLKGLENPELSLTIRSGTTSICAVQIVRDMSEGVWPTAKKVISLNLMSAYSDSGTTPAVYGLEPVPDAAWTKDGLGSISSSGTDVSATIMEWDGSSAVEASGVTVNEKANNAYGWSGYNYTPQNQMLSGYLDDGGSRATVTVTGVPYAVYDVIVYMATDTEDRQFGPVKVNDVPYRWDDGSGEAVVADSADSAAATRWGASRSRLPAYGLNAIRIPSQISSTLTIVGANNANSARGCIAAIQIVEAYSGLKVYSNGSWSGDGTEPTSGDAIIVVDGDTSLSIDGTASLDTVTITGTGTLTLGGSGTFTVDVLEIAQNSHIVMNESRLSATAVIGEGTAIYDNAVPATGKGWTDSAKWKGTVQVRNVTNMVGDSREGVWLKFNDYGNSGSVVELNNVTGWFEPAYNCTVPLKITGTLTINNGNSGKNNAFKVGTLLGSGTIDGSGSAPFMVFQILNDWSGFTGAVQLSTSKVVAFGSEVPSTVADDNNDAGTIYIAVGAEVEIKSSSLWWAAGVGFVVDGTLKAESRDKWGGGTAITLGDTGVLNISSTGNLDSRSKNFSNVTGTGTVRFSGSGWATLPDGANMFADTLSVELEQASGVVCGADTTKTIGSIFGTKNLRSDMDGSGKTLIVKQAKDGVWSGSFHGGNDRLEKMVVQGGASSTGTLTLAGTTTADGGNTYNDKLEVASSGSVKLTGQWIGDTTVAGTFGGTGTLTGNLTFSDGATFKAFSTDSDGLSVSGAVTFPTTDGESVTVDLTGVTLDPDGTTLITANSINSVSKLASTRGVLIQESNVLKAYPVASLTKADGSSVPYNSIYEAMVGAYQNPTYQYVTVYAASPTEVTLLLETTKLKVVGDSSLVTIVARSAEYSYSAGSPVEGVTTYTLTANPTTYTWSHSGSSYAWSSQWNWRFGDNVQAERYPMAGDSVVFPDGAAVTLDANADCAAITVNGAVAIGGDYGLNVSGNVTGGTGTPVLSITSADLNLSALSSVSGVALILADSTATVLATAGATLAAIPTTTVEDSYVKTTSNVGATTYSVAAKTVVTVSVGANVSLTIDGNAVADGATLKFAPEDTFTYVATPAANYTANVAVTGGTDNDGTVTVGETAITVAATATRNGATVSNVAVSYGPDYTSATVTATVSDSTLDYYISWGNGEPVKGTVSSGSTVTFDVSGIAHSAPYQSSGYNISAKDGETTVTTTGGSGESVAADVDANWINENATTHGQQAAGGSWTNAEAVTYSEGKAAITDNRFEATSMSTSSRVVLEFNVCFSATNDADVEGDAQGAIKLGTDNDATTFMVLAQGGGWTAVSNDALTPDPAATYKVVMTFDYANNTYSVSVDDYVLTNGSGSASFPLAKNNATGVQDIDFAGTGTLVSMKGDQLEGYMVKDNAGGWYATIEAATQSYDSANGPYTVLHDGTAPSGWKIDDVTKALIKAAKGLFFMAY